MLQNLYCIMHDYFNKQCRLLSAVLTFLNIAVQLQIVRRPQYILNMIYFIYCVVQYLKKSMVHKDIGAVTNMYVIHQLISFDVG